MAKNDNRFDIPSVREPATMADLEHSKEIHAQKVDLLERAEKGENIDISTLPKEITKDKDFMEFLTDAMQPNNQLKNIYAITNAEDYKMFMQDEWKDNNLYWASSIDSKTEYSYEELMNKPNVREGANLYFRVQHNSIIDRNEIQIYTSKQKALEDVKNYQNMNVDKTSDLKKISQPSRLDKIEDLGYAWQMSKEQVSEALAKNEYTEYDLKAVRAILKHGSEWHNHVYEMKPIMNPTKEQTLNWMNKDGMALQYLSKEQKNDKEIVMAAIKENGLAVQYASKELQVDYDIYHEFPKHLEIKTPEDKELMKAVLETEHFAFDLLPDALKNDKELAIYAMEQNPFNMWHIGENLKNDKEFVLEELTKFPTFHIDKVSDNLKLDADVVKASMEHNTNFRETDLAHVLKNFPDNKELVEASIQKFNRNGYLHDDMRAEGNAMIDKYRESQKAQEPQKPKTVDDLIKAAQAKKAEKQASNRDRNNTKEKERD